MSVLLANALEASSLDLLVLGALADRLRQAERGDVVRVHVDRPGEDGVRSFAGTPEDGAAFLRAVAIARLSGERGAPIRVDAESVGLPLAQVALAFGADELVAPIERLSLEVYAEGETTNAERAVLREREIAALVRTAGRVPRVVEHRGGESIEREPDTTTHAIRRFRAPGREARARALTSDGLQEKG